MDLENKTRYPAHIFRGCVDTERIVASLVVRKTFDLVGNELRPAKEQVWKVSGGPWDSPIGPMAGDELFYRGGVDVFVFGSARAPKNKPVPRMEVCVEVGENFRHAIAIIGDRTWQKKEDRLVATEPKPFTAVKLELANAFGGKDEWDELPMPFPDNPAGKGYFVSEENAVGKPLPNIENPKALIQKWDDRPDPVGVGPTPLGFGPRLKRSLELDEESGAIKKLHPTYFNAAFPDMVAPKLKPGVRVRVSGVTADIPIEFAVPASGTRIRMTYGEQATDIDPPIDQIGIEVDACRVFVTYRYPFRYKIIALQKRTCELLALDSEGAIP